MSKLLAKLISMESIVNGILINVGKDFSGTTYAACNKLQMSELLVLLVIMDHPFGSKDMSILMDRKELASHMNHARVKVGHLILNVN
jgi:hypothetical protein